MSVVDKIHHYQRNIEKCNDNGDRMLYCISKLSNLPVTVQHLQETGVGRTVNALRKYDGVVGDAAKALVAKWKAMVANEESSEPEEEDEACVPDAPESYSDGHESPKEEESTANTHPRRKSEETKHRHKSEGSENPSSTHNSKHSSKHEKTKSSESHRIGNETSKESNAEKPKKHEKSKHSHKHQSSKSDRKSSSRESKEVKSIPKKDEVQITRPENDIKSESLEKPGVCDSKSSKSYKSSEENPKKRKGDGSSSGKKETKRRKNSESESDDGKLHVSSSSENQSIIGSVKIKEEPKDKDIYVKMEIKQEKKHSHDKVKSSSKHKSEPSNSKSKDNEEKHKERSESHQSYKKDENRRDDSHSNKESSESKSHSSSSSSKHHHKSKDRSKKKESKDEDGKHGKKSSAETGDSKQRSKDPKETIRVKQEINGDEGIDCNSGASFAEALGMCMMPQSSKKRTNNSPNTSSAKVCKTEQISSTTGHSKKPSYSKAEETSSDNLQPPSLLAPNVKLEPLSVDLVALPEINPNYKPLAYISPLNRREEDKALTDVIYSKNQRTKVYSGNKCGYTSVPSLYEMCIRVLIENIDALEFTGGVPYDIIKPVLERATPDQLFMLEHYNPYLIEDTDPLWQFHCSREFRNKQREEMESWRETYMRCLDEREAKLKTLTANIKQSIDKSVPLRSTKLAYVDNVVKPPRNVLKKQAKYGTANALPTASSDLKKKLIAGGGPNSATNISVPPPPMPRIKTSTAVVKKTKAPLMAKALQLIKGRYKR